MAQVKAGVLRDKSVDELRQQEIDLRNQIFKLRFQKALGTAENPQRITMARKDLARVLTILRQKAAAGR